MSYRNPQVYLHIITYPYDKFHIVIISAIEIGKDHVIWEKTHIVKFY